MTGAAPHLGAILLVAGGMVCLALGAGWLVDGASRLALRLGIAPMLVGLTVVGFGTSMPEFSVSVLAAARGSRGLSLGNAVGSNIMNLLLVMGVAALIRPIAVHGDGDGAPGRTLERDLLLGLLPAGIIMAAAWRGGLSRPWAAALVLVFGAFVWLSVRSARRTRGERVAVRGSVAGNAALTVVGIVLLVGGAELMVRGGVTLARAAGISEAVIGLTLVAFGTSLPELATSVAAAIKSEPEISVGNVLGSNVFNLGLVVGTAFLIRPGAVPVFVIRQDVPFLVGATVLVGGFVLRDGRISRTEGGGMLLAFVGYMVFLAMRGLGG